MASVEVSQIKTRSFNEDLNMIISELEIEIEEKRASLINEVCEQGEDRYLGILGNRIRGVDLSLFDHREWAGAPLEAYPKIIPSGANIYVQHHGSLPEGAKGGFTYVDSSCRMWLIAYDYPNDKVYVKAGSAGPIDWEDVKCKLDKSSNKEDHKDPIRGGRASAIISGCSLFAFFLVDHAVGN